MNIFQKLLNNFKANQDNKSFDFEQLILDLEDKLLSEDFGWEYTEKIIDYLKKEKNNIKNEISLKNKLEEYLQNKLNNINKYKNWRDIIPDNEINIIFVIGINGVGKTTSIAKISNQWNNENINYCIAPCDTFRAGAYEQLYRWADQYNLSIYQTKTANKKPNTVLYECLDYAQRQNINNIIIDTAGRLNNKIELLEELGAMKKAVEKKYIGQKINIYSWLVIDGHSGNNSLNQAIAFNEIIKLNGLIISKMDNTAKAGFIYNITEKLNISIIASGYGEGINDLSLGIRTDN